MPSTRPLTTPIGLAADNSAQAGRSGNQHLLARTRPATAAAGLGEPADHTATPANMSATPRAITTSPRLRPRTSRDGGGGTRRGIDSQSKRDSKVAQSHLSSYGSFTRFTLHNVRGLTESGCGSAMGAAIHRQLRLDAVRRRDLGLTRML
jgi:hypothetical protein